MQPSNPPVENELDRIMDAASRILSARYGVSFIVVEPRVLRRGIRSLTIRCAVQPEAAGIRSVIIKQVTTPTACAMNDWASLEFLSSIEETAGLAPRFLGGDLDQGLIVMEDLGGSGSLEDVLNGSSAKLAGQCLESLAIQAAWLHARTMGREEDYLQIRRKLPMAEEMGRRQEADRWSTGCEKVRTWISQTGCPIPPGFDESLAAVAEAYARPGPFLAFTHGDFAPGNNHVLDRRVRLLDFEYAGFRHALYDMTVWNVLCPLPADLLRDACRVYRAELSNTCNAAEDDERWQEEWASITAFRTLAMLQWTPISVLEENRPWADGWTSREAVLAALQRLCQSAAPVPFLRPITEAARRLEDALRARWPDRGSSVPCWPALEQQAILR